MQHPISAVYLVITVAEDKIIAALITFQSTKILTHNIINHCTVFWHLISLQTHGSLTQTAFLNCISSSHPYMKQHAPTNAAPYIF